MASAADIVRRHVVRGRKCSCARHWGDSYPEACSREYRELPVEKQHHISQIRAGLISDDVTGAFVIHPRRQP